MFFLDLSHSHTLSPDIRVHRAGSQLKILHSQFLDNGTKQNIKLWLVLVATYMKIKMRYPWYILYVSVI